MTMDINKYVESEELIEFGKFGPKPKVGASSKSSEQDIIEMCQNFLVGLEFITDFTPGVLDDITLAAARKFVGKKINTICDVDFIEKAKSFGLYFGDLKFLIPDNVDDDSHKKLRKKELKLEALDYSVEDGKVKVGLDWYRRNIVKLEVPHLKNVSQYWERIKMNKAVADQFMLMMEEFRKEKLLRYIVTWNGSYNPRFIRGSKTRLSNHALGTAFDINAQYNRLGHKPAKESEIGTVIPLVEIANAHGFAWGGHYKNRKDGMHFEAKYKVEMV